MFRLGKNLKSAVPNAALGEMIMRRTAVAVVVSILIVWIGIPLLEKSAFAAERSVQLNVPGCMA